MGVRVAIVSKHCTEWEYVSDQLSLDRRFQMQPLLTPAQAEQGLTRDQFDLVVICLDEFGERQLAVAEKLRQRLPEPLLVFLAREISASARFMLQGKGLRTALLSSQHDLRNVSAI